MSELSKNDALNYEMAGFDRLKSNLGDSAYHNWKQVNRRLDELLYSTLLPYTYPLLRKVSEEVLRIPVFETKMQEYGRLMVKPVWEPAVGGFSAFHGHNIRFFSISIAINRELSPEQKLLALGHELGHYIAHMNMYLALLLIQIDTIFHARSEHIAAESLTQEWWETYADKTEQHADMIGSMFLVQPGLAEEILRKAHYDQPVTPEALNYMILLGLEGESGDFPASAIPRMVKEAEIAQAQALARPYSRHDSLFNRIAWCAFQPFDADILPELKAWRGKAEKKLFSLMNRVHKENERKRRTPPPEPRSARIFIRMTVEQVEKLIRKYELWDPVIIEPPSNQARGYIPLILAYEPKNKYDPIDWVSWFDPYRGAQGFLDVWYEAAVHDDKGLMLFPLDPVTKAERKALQDRVKELSMGKLMDYLLESEND